MLAAVPTALLADLDFGAVVGFSLVLTIIVVAIVLDRRKRARHPDQPWLRRKDWAAGRILSGEPDVLRQYVVAMALVILLVAVFLVVEDKPFTGPSLFFISFFLAGGVAILIAAARATLHWRKFGRSAFEMRSVPGVIGGELAGVIRVPTRLCPESGYDLSLVCLHRFRRRSPRAGDQSHTTTVEVVLWQQNQPLVQALPAEDARCSLIPVEFKVPADQPSSGDENPNYSYIIWRLEARATLPGLDYQARFDVPVFALEDSPEESAPPLPPGN